MQLDEKIASIISEPLAARGYDLVAVSLSFGSKSATVEIAIDRFDAAPVSVDDCSVASRIISALLDVEDPIEGRYFLNVSSPGEHRPVRNPAKDLHRFCGEEVTLELLPDSPSATAAGGVRKVRGILQKCDATEAEVSSDLSSSSSDHLPNRPSSSPSKILISDIKKATVHRIFKI